MARHDIIEGLSKDHSQLEHSTQNCWICHLAKLCHNPKGKTVDTANYLPGQLLHMDFYFWGLTSIRGFSSVLLVVDCKTRRQWKFLTSSKSPPLEIIHWFINQLRLAGRPITCIRTDRGGELARSNEVCALLLHHSVTLQTTAG